MPIAKKLSAASLAMLLATALNAQAQIICTLCSEVLPVSVPAGTAVICEPYAGLETLKQAPASNTLVLPLSCGVAQGDEAEKKRFEGALIGSNETSLGRMVIAWKQLSFPNAMEAGSVDRVTFEMNDRETFELREWSDGKLRVSFKRDLVFTQKH